MLGKAHHIRCVRRSDNRFDLLTRRQIWITKLSKRHRSHGLFCLTPMRSQRLVNRDNGSVVQQQFQKLSGVFFKRTNFWILDGSRTLCSSLWACTLYNRNQPIARPTRRDRDRAPCHRLRFSERPVFFHASMVCRSSQQW